MCPQTVLPVLFLFAFHAVAADRAAIVEERHSLFTLATLAVTYQELQNNSPVGHPISAALAWDVDDISKTPQFAVDKNRNLKNQSEIFHAEVSTLHRAWKTKKSPYPPGLAPVDKRSHYGARLENATMYTTLEPCPMCSSTVLMSHVPKIIFAMQDSAFRDPKTHVLDQPLVGSFYGRRIDAVGSTTAWAGELNTKVWEAEQQVFAGKVTDPKMVWKDARGVTRLNLISYLYREGNQLFKPGFDAFVKYSVKNPENEKLYRALMKNLFPAIQVKTH
jgi:tRNA(Arg) A34 adenosine deaminase TadA